MRENLFRPGRYMSTSIYDFCIITCRIEEVMLYLCFVEFYGAAFSVRLFREDRHMHLIEGLIVIDATGCRLLRLGNL